MMLTKENQNDIDLYVDDYLREHDGHHFGITGDIVNFIDKDKKSVMKIYVILTRCKEHNSKIIGQTLISEDIFNVLIKHGLLNHKTEIEEQ